MLLRKYKSKFYKVLRFIWKSILHAVKAYKVSTQSFLPISNIMLHWPHSCLLSICLPPFIYIIVKISSPSGIWTLWVERMFLVKYKWTFCVHNSLLISPLLSGLTISSGWDTPQSLSFLRAKLLCYSSKSMWEAIAANSHIPWLPYRI